MEGENQLIKEYELTQSAFHQNEHSVLQFASIFLAGTFVLIAGALASKSPVIFSLASLLIIISMIVWRLHAERISKIGKATMKRLIELEKELGFKQHHYAQDAKSGISINQASWIFVSVILVILLFLNFALWLNWDGLRKEERIVISISPIWWIIVPLSIICGTILIGIGITQWLPQSKFKEDIRDIKQDLDTLKDMVVKLNRHLGKE